MKKAYMYLAFAISVLVLVQAASMVFAVAGLGKWVEDGNTLTKETFEADEAPFGEVVGFMIHGMNGMMLIPLVAIALLVVAFLAKVPNGPKLAGIVLGLVVLQIALGIIGHSVPALGALHGVNAFALFGVALAAGMKARQDLAGTTASPPMAKV